MILISLHKDNRGMWHVPAMDAGHSNERVISSGGAATPREAARWHLRNANRLATEIEGQLVELGMLTEIEIAEFSDEESKKT